MKIIPYTPFNMQNDRFRLVADALVARNIWRGNCPKMAEMAILTPPYFHKKITGEISFQLNHKKWQNWLIKKFEDFPKKKPEHKYSVTFVTKVTTTRQFVSRRSPTCSNCFLRSMEQKQPEKLNVIDTTNFFLKQIEF